MPHHNLADLEPWLGYATEGQAVGGIPFENTLESLLQSQCHRGRPSKAMALFQRKNEVT